MGRIGVPELVIVFVIVLLIFGPKKLPDLAKGLAQSIRGFKDALKEGDDQASTKSSPNQKS
jgi:sec-independent protein translocase protein TatA